LRRIQKWGKLAKSIERSQLGWRFFSAVPFFLNPQ
jgi:hypothetical protein